MSSRLLLLCCIAATIRCVLSCPSSKKDTRATSNAKSPNKAMELFLRNEATPRISSEFPNPGAPAKSPNKAIAGDEGEATPKISSAIPNPGAPAKSPNKAIAGATPEISSAIPNPELYLGCFHKSVLLYMNLVIKNSDSLTHSKCASECMRRATLHKKNYTTIGLRDSRDCYCGYGTRIRDDLRAYTDICYNRCSGNHRQPCGDGSYYTIYNLTAKMLEPDEYDVDKRGLRIVPVFTDKPEGCYFSLSDDEILLKHEKMTHRRCAAECVRRRFYPEYKYFGLIKGDSCECALKLPGEDNKILLDEKSCQTRCAGNGSQPCGSADAPMIYKLSSKLTSATLTEEQVVRFVPVLPAEPVGCYHLFQYQGFWKHNNMTHQMCAADCVRMRINPENKYFILRDGDSCSCKMELQSLNLINPYSEKYCQTRCAGNASQTCGGPGSGMIYRLSSKRTSASPTGETSDTSH